MFADDTFLTNSQLQQSRILLQPRSVFEVLVFIQKPSKRFSDFIQLFHHTVFSYSGQEFLQSVKQKSLTCFSKVSVQYQYKHQ